MNWDYNLSNKALKKIKQIPRKDALRIFNTLQTMKQDPFVGDLQRIAGARRKWRRRVGNYRIFFYTTTDKRIFDVLDIKRRTSKTY